MLADADVVILVAGVGGGRGSGVTPIMASLASEAGALTVAAVVPPFEWEVGRNRKTDTAIKYLEREANLVVQFSNHELGETLGDDTPSMTFSLGKTSELQPDGEVTIDFVEIIGNAQIEIEGLPSLERIVFMSKFCHPGWHRTSIYQYDIERFRQARLPPPS